MKEAEGSAVEFETLPGPARAGSEPILEVIDTHVHVISIDDVRYPRSPLGGVQSEWSSIRTATWEHVDSDMQRAGIAQAAIVQASTAYGHDNSYVADCVARASDRIVGVGSIGLTDDDVVEQIGHWVSRRGLAGVRAFVTGSTMTRALHLDDPQTTAAWELLERERIPVAMNIDEHSIPGLTAVLEQYPDLVVALDHAGRTQFPVGPPYLEGKAVDRLADFPNVYLKLTTRTLRSAQNSAGGVSGLLEELIGRFGSARMAWGSNWPATEGTLPEMASLLRESVAALDLADALNICSATARRLYPGLSRPAPTGHTSGAAA